MEQIQKLSDLYRFVVAAFGCTYAWYYYLLVGTAATLTSGLGRLTPLSATWPAL